MIKLAILGLGGRGQLFSSLMADDSMVKLVSIAEPNAERRNKIKEKFIIEDSMSFETAEDFFKAGKICDAIFLCTQDGQHYEQTITALNLGYDICLEKPAAITINDCEAIRDLANKLNRKVMLTHVLRYSPFYQTMKRFIHEGKIGDVVTINQTENIAYWHFALSYVRGPWANMAESSPTIIAKCCHDLDIIRWLVSKKCEYVSSFGSLSYYKEEKAPKGSANFCADCQEATKEKCLYDAFKIYPKRVQHSVVGGLGSRNASDIMEVLNDRKSQIGKCVFRSDNDAVDHQVVNMLFEDNITAHLTMTAFSERCYRFVKIHGTNGEMYGDMEENIIYYTPFGQEMQKFDVSKDSEIDLNDGHGGGDYYLYQDFINYITINSPSYTRTDITDSIESHLIGFKAEESRLNNGKVLKID